MNRPPFLGHGVGLRREHFDRLLESSTRCDFLEVISENFMGVGGRARATLLALRKKYPVVLHGVSLSIGSTDPLDLRYLDALRELAEEIQPAWVSDHLCWTGADGVQAHDLLPLPFTEEALDHVVARVRRVQDRLGRNIALENVSSYLTYRFSQMPEWEFLSRVAEEADCGILLDVNNFYVSSVNHGFDPREYLAGVCAERVWQIHLAGPSRQGPLLIDTHDTGVLAPVWELYEETIRRIGPTSTLIEWDAKIPTFDVLEAEMLEAARRHRAAIESVPVPGAAP
jgi:uncharacterized protein (UPF0276 family)